MRFAREVVEDRRSSLPARDADREEKPERATDQSYQEGRLR
jgi:hypothetical protein